MNDYEVGYGKPPQSGNFKEGYDPRRGLKPKGSQSAKAILQKYGAVKVSPTRDLVKELELTALEDICITAIVDARNGDKEARNFVFDRLEGKPINRNENTEIPATPEQKLQQIQEEVRRLLEDENDESESLIAVIPQENTLNAVNN